LTFAALPGVKIDGMVARVGYVVDPAAATMRAGADVPNPK
jgi:hypothetical protein